MTASELLDRKADEWKALGEEMTEEDSPTRLMYTAIEASLREVALALETERQEAA